MVIGSDSPKFALYDSGEVIYRKGEEYRSAKLNAREIDDIFSSLNLQNLARVAKSYHAIDITDQPSEFLFISIGGKAAVADVYGSLQNPVVRSKIPAVLSSAFDRLEAFDVVGSRRWLPEKIEVMIWPYEYAPDKSIDWPKDWPDLQDRNTIKRAEGYSLFLPSAHYNELVSFLESRGEKGAVAINGRKWAASLRLPFPSEWRWMGAINQTDPE